MQTFTHRRRMATASSLGAVRMRRLGCSGTPRHPARRSRGAATSNLSGSHVNPLHLLSCCRYWFDQSTRRLADHQQDVCDALETILRVSLGTALAEQHNRV
ncbi:unnamed protein product [Boreogadus saida]